MGGWALLAGRLEEETREALVEMRGTQAVYSSMSALLVPTCFPRDPGDVSERQSCFSLFADWRGPGGRDREEGVLELHEQVWMETALQTSVHLLISH